MNERDLMAEAARRFGPRLKAVQLVRDILETRFDKQQAFISDPARRKAALCTRRAGKTEADAAYLLTGALSESGHICVFMARTRLRAKELTWKAVFGLMAQHGLIEGTDYSKNETTLTVSFPNGSEIRWRGCDNITDLRRKRGDKLWLVIIDEAQDVDALILGELIEDIFGPSLEDLGGTIALTGTPGFICSGPWYEMTRPDEIDRTPGWSIHEWGVLDNPYMAHMQKRLPEMMAERRWTEETPTYLREWKGRWVNDTGAMFYKFLPGRNTFTLEELKPYGPGWSHIRGWDLGRTDSMALVYFGFHPERRELYEAHSWSKSGIDSDDVVAYARSCEASLGLSVVASVADTGGLGALVVAEVAKRLGEHFEPAKKTEKAAHVRLMNEDFTAGRIKLIKGSPYASEIAVLPKLADWDEAKTGKPAPEDPRFANHCADAGLYAWRKAWHYRSEPKADAPTPGTPEFYRAEERKLEETLTEQATLESEQPWWEL